MTEPKAFSHIDLQLVRILHEVLVQRSVSRAAVSLGMRQPAVSAALKRLRDLLGDPIVVRSGTHMVPTDVGRQFLEPAANILHEAERLFTDARQFDPVRTQTTFRVAAPDYLDPLFLPGVFQSVARQAPGATIEVVALTADFDYVQHLGQDLDLVIGNWLEPPEGLHLGRLLSDEVVCMVARDHPAVGLYARGAWDVAHYLASAHIAPGLLYPGGRGVIDQRLEQLGLERRITARCAHFGLIPQILVGSPWVLTTGRLFCSRYLQQAPLVVLPCPIPFGMMDYFQLWHPRNHASGRLRWLRDQVRKVALSLSMPAGAVAAPAVPVAAD